MSAFKSQRGQAAVLSVVMITGLLGMAGLVLDVGSWFRAQRATQAAADAAALAAAQKLPEEPGSASALASSYVDKNGGGAASVTFAHKFAANDTVTVVVSRQAPGFFAKVLGFDSVQVSARATARASGMGAARWVAPITVDIDHPDLNCGQTNGRPVPCFGKPTQLDLLHLHGPGSGNAAGSFGLINLDQQSGGNIGAGLLASWVLSGFDRYLEPGFYDSAPSANFNNGQFLGALEDRRGDILLFPIYRTLAGSGSNAKFDVVGWVGFKVSDFHANGSDGIVKGSFETVVWEGIQSSSGAGLNYGARSIQLVG